MVGEVEVDIAPHIAKNEGVVCIPIPRCSLPNASLGIILAIEEHDEGKHKNRAKAGGFVSDEGAEYLQQAPATSSAQTYEAKKEEIKEEDIKKQEEEEKKMKEVENDRLE